MVLTCKKLHDHLNKGARNLDTGILYIFGYDKYDFWSLFFYSFLSIIITFASRKKTNR